MVNPRLLLFLVLLFSLTTPTPVPLGIPGSWDLTLDEEFNGNTLNPSLWVPQVSATSGFATGQAPGIACYVNSTNNIAVGNGYLNLTVRQESAPFSCGAVTTQFTSGMVSTYQRFNQAYGVFEVRAQLPNVTVPGLQETFWLWPQNETLYGVVWPAAGEIDFAEFYSQYYYLVVPYLHYNLTNATLEAVTAYNCRIDISQFNTYSVEWNTTTITIYYNGQVCFFDHWKPQPPLVAPEPFSQPFFISLTQGLGVTSNAYQAGVTPLPATTVIDYVRVWQASSSSNSVTTGGASTGSGSGTSTASSGTTTGSGSGIGTGTGATTVASGTNSNPQTASSSSSSSRLETPVLLMVLFILGLLRRAF